MLRYVAFVNMLNNKKSDRENDLANVSSISYLTTVDIFQTKSLNAD